VRRQWFGPAASGSSMPAAGLFHRLAIDPATSWRRAWFVLAGAACVALVAVATVAAALRPANPTMHVLAPGEAADAAGGVSGRAAMPAGAEALANRSDRAGAVPTVQLVAAANGPAPRAAQLPDAPLSTFNGRPVRAVRTIDMVVTAYCPCKLCCGPNARGLTASGKTVRTNGMKLVAADRDLPFGTLVSVPGYDAARPVPVLDRGSAIVGDHLDVLMPTHAAAVKWGRKVLPVMIWEYAD
jgi:3D (Asp-Asp-Asp) domain-containing protein